MDFFSICNIKNHVATIVAQLPFKIIPQRPIANGKLCLNVLYTENVSFKHVLLSKGVLLI